MAKRTSKDYEALLAQHGYVDHTTGRTVDVYQNGTRKRRAKPLNPFDFGF